jgi:hypothetical protein
MISDDCLRKEARLLVGLWSTLGLYAALELGEKSRDELSSRNYYLVNKKIFIYGECSVLRDGRERSVRDSGRG